VLLILIVSTGIPAPDSATPDRLVGMAIGGTLTLVAAFLLWPDRMDVDIRRRLAAALGPLAAAVDGIAAGAPADSIARSREAAGRALTGARPYALGLAERPIGAATVAAAERLLPPASRRPGSCWPASTRPISAPPTGRCWARLARSLGALRPSSEMRRASHRTSTH
jgi:HAMP domain-containing protein